MNKLCEYGCGREAKYPPRKGSPKWSCEEYYSKCPAIKKKNSCGNLGKKRNVDLILRYKKKYPGLFNIEKMRYNPDKPGEKEIQVHCKYIYCNNSLMNGGWFVPTKSQLGERLRCYKTGIGKCFFFCSSDCKEKFFKKFYNKILNRKKIHIGKDNGMYMIPSPNKYKISNIKKKYSIFSKIEEMRYNPDKPGKKEIQVHCKNHNCPNSKEQGGWFTPNSRQITERIRHIENKGVDNSYFYCSDKCKQECPLYGLKFDPFKNDILSYTISEYNQFRDFVLERDDYKCQYCGEKAEHVHHERPQKLEPFFSLDPDLAWSVCKKCHYKYGHKDECSTGKLANKQC